MKMRARIVVFLLAVLLVTGNMPQVTAYAAPKGTATEERARELTDLEITGLEEPAAGKTLDATATVRSAEGVEWEIPVVWIDDIGKAVTVAEPGRKYLPAFAFYVPEGYRVSGVAYGRSFKVKLPPFLTALYGSGSLVFISDPSLGITYITWNPAAVSGFSFAVNNIQSNHDDSADSSSHEDNDTDNDPEGVIDQGNPPGILPAGEEDPYWEVKAYCSKGAIANIGYETLAELLKLIKEEIEPRAVAALLEAFPAFVEAAENGEIGSQIGLFICDARFDDPKEDPRVLDQCAAVGTGYDDVNRSDFYYMISINSERILSRDDDGKYTLNENGLNELKNTLTHELMHAFMDDYTRTGTVSDDDSFNFPQDSGDDRRYNCFPKWFIEGTASTVEDVYRFQRYEFFYMSNVYNEMRTRQDGEALYSAESLAACFQEPENSVKRYRTDYNGDYMSYAGGYLMTVYLASLIANENRDPGIPDNETVKWGLNTILEKLHNGTSLDEIIRNTGRYDGIIDFENRFATMGDDSTQFCVDFLNHLDDISQNKGKLANGSILLPFDTDKDTPLDGRTETSNGQSVLKIEYDDDSIFENAVLSTVDDDKAKQSAGSYHTWDDTDESLGAGTAAAAAKMPADISEHPGEGIRGAGINENTDNTDASDMNATDTDAPDTNDTATDTYTDAATDTGILVGDINDTATGTDTEMTTPGTDAETTSPGTDAEGISSGTDTGSVVSDTDAGNSARDADTVSATDTDSDNNDRNDSGDEDSE